MFCQTSGGKCGVAVDGEEADRAVEAGVVVRYAIVMGPA